MKSKFFHFIALLNILTISLGAFLAYSDLNLRQYDTREHLNTTVTDVEYSVLFYRPTYEYYDKRPAKIMETTGSWTFDFFQSSIFLMAIVDVSLIYSHHKKEKLFTKF